MRHHGSALYLSVAVQLLHWPGQVRLRQCTYDASGLESSKMEVNEMCVTNLIQRTGC